MPTPIPMKLAPRLRELIATLPKDSPARARALRLSGVVKNRLTLPRDALADLAEARRAAVAAKDYGELVEHRARGERRLCVARQRPLRRARASASRLPSPRCTTTRGALARALAETGRIELEGGRYERAAMLFREIAEGAAKDSAAASGAEAQGEFLPGAEPNRQRRPGSRHCAPIEDRAAGGGGAARLSGPHRGGARVCGARTT